MVWQELSRLLRGAVITDEDVIAELASDFGRIAQGKPRAVVGPADGQDVQRLLQWANRVQCPVTVRGAGHSQSGQAVCHGDGVLLDMSTLRRIGRPEGDSVWVEAGATWAEVVEAMLPWGWIPPVLTNNLAVTVGGTLSMAGLGVASHRYGTQADNVTELEVVTGDGDFVRCSETENRDLFDAVRCGLGQFGVIVRGRIRLRRYSPNVRTFYLLYDDLEALMQDQALLLREQRFDFIEGWCAPCPQGLRTIGGMRVPFAEWFFPVHLSVEYADAAPPEAVLHGLHHYRLVYLEDSSLSAFTGRMEPVFEWWRETGAWNLAHPWMEVILPWDRAAEYVLGVLRSLPPTLLAGGHVLLWPCRGTVSEAPMFVHPDGEFVLGFGILPAVPRARLNMALSLLNRASELAYQVGGTRYLSGWLDFNHQQWRRHYGERWSRVVAWKKFFDPNHVLNRGVIAYEPGEGS